MKTLDEKFLLVINKLIEINKDINNIQNEITALTEEQKQFADYYNNEVYKINGRK